MAKHDRRLVGLRAGIVIAHADAVGLGELQRRHFDHVVISLLTQPRCSCMSGGGGANAASSASNSTGSMSHEHLHMGNDVGAGDEAEIELVAIALHGDVERNAVGRDRHREDVQQLRARRIERLPRPRHVGDRDVRRRRQHVGQAGAAVEQRQDLHQDRRAQHRDVGHLRHQGAQRMRHLLRLGGLRDDRLQPRLGILDVGGDRADHAEHLVVGVGVALLAQRDRHRGRQRLCRQRALLQQIAPHHAGGRAPAPRH